jgi:hypothetical protein
MDMIHALGASVSMATGGAKAVQGGNWRIFEAMLKNASATMHLGTTVSRDSNLLDPVGGRDKHGRTSGLWLTIFSGHRYPSVPR